MKTEAKIQQEIVKWFRANYYKKGVIFSVPNERASYMEIKDLLLTGLLAGASDLIVVLEGKVLFVEVKNEKGKQSDKQKRFEGNVAALSHEYHLVRTLKEFKTIFNGEKH